LSQLVAEVGGIEAVLDLVVGELAPAEAIVFVLTVRVADVQPGLGLRAETMIEIQGNRGVFKPVVVGIRSGAQAGAAEAIALLVVKAQVEAGGVVAAGQA